MLQLVDRQNLNEINFWASVYYLETPPSFYELDLIAEISLKQFWMKHVPLHLKLAACPNKILVG